MSATEKITDNLLEMSEDERIEWFVAKILSLQSRISRLEDVEDIRP